MESETTIIKKSEDASNNLPEKELIIFALEKLIDETANQKGFWGFIKRKSLTSAIKDVQNGKYSPRAERELRNTADRYFNLIILDNQLCLITHLPPLRSNDLLVLTGLFYETLTTFLELKSAKANAIKPGSSKKDLYNKQIMERQAEAILSGDFSSPANIGQEKRLLNQAMELKEKIGN